MRRIQFATLLAAFLPACARPPDESLQDSAASADSSLGTFTGTLPCADCAGIRTELRLLVARQSGQPTRYEATETYVATRDGDRTFERSGHWTILRGTPDAPDATVYQLDFDQPQAVRNFLKAGDRELRLLDHEQRDIPSLTPHSLHRVPDANAVAVTLGEADAGRTIEVRRGQSIAVLLPSNRSTGFRWSLVPALAGVLTAARDAAYTQDSSGAVGAPGRRDLDVPGEPGGTAGASLRVSAAVGEDRAAGQGDRAHDRRPLSSLRRAVATPVTKVQYAAQTGGATLNGASRLARVSPQGWLHEHANPKRPHPASATGSGGA